ncbi:hypothetical protein [Lentibacillus jeotgali]|nr:hypothetical protein [Lentibacillus jeotgali]
MSEGRKHRQKNENISRRARTSTEEQRHQQKNQNIIDKSKQLSQQG